MVTEPEVFGWICTSRRWTSPARLAIPETVRLSAYRVVEEAPGNIARHAHAIHVLIALSAAASDGKLSRSVDDDGRGFRADQVREGLGLGSIAGHVGQVGGSLADPE